MKRIKRFSDPFLAIGWTLLSFLVASMCIFVLSFVPFNRENLPGYLIFGGGLAYSLIMPFTVAQRSYSYFCFTNQGIEIHVPFRQTSKQEYTQYHYSYCAQYYHSTVFGSIGYWRRFIV